MLRLKECVMHPVPLTPYLVAILPGTWKACRPHPAWFLTVCWYCRNRSFRVITNCAFLFFTTRLPSSRDKTSGLWGRFGKWLQREG